MNTTNKDLVRAFYTEIDAGNFDALDDLVAEEWVNHTPPAFAGLSPGRKGLKEACELWREATPHYHEVQEQIAEGDLVATRLTTYGTHEGDLPGAPRTGAKLKMTGIAMHRISEGKLSEQWFYGQGWIGAATATEVRDGKDSTGD